MTRRLVVVSNRAPVTYGLDDAGGRTTRRARRRADRGARGPRLRARRDMGGERDLGRGQARRGDGRRRGARPLRQHVPPAARRARAVHLRPLLQRRREPAAVVRPGQPSNLQRTPDIQRNEIEAFEYSYNIVNEDLATAVVEEIEGDDEPVVMVHDYRLHAAGARAAHIDVFLHFIHIPWTRSNTWRSGSSAVRPVESRWSSATRRPDMVGADRPGGP